MSKLIICLRKSLGQIHCAKVRHCLFWNQGFLKRYR